MPAFAREVAPFNTALTTDPIPALWADDPNRFWVRRADTRTVDAARTAKLGAVDIAIRTNGGVTWDGSVYGQPVQQVKLGAGTTGVLDSSRSWWEYLTGAAWQQLPLPELVRIEGDPIPAGDRTWLAIQGTRWAWEAWCLRRIIDNIIGFQGAGFAASKIVRWDLTTPWDRQSLTGVAAGGFPSAPLVIGWDELRPGGVGLMHATKLVLPNYGRGFTTPARNGDGTYTAHPLRAGEWLRLKLDVVLRILKQYGESHPVVALAWGLYHFGCYVGDRSDMKDVEGNRYKSGVAALLMSQDIRHQLGEGTIPGVGDLGLRLVDFEVVQ